MTLNKPPQNNFNADDFKRTICKRVHDSLDWLEEKNTSRQIHRELAILGNVVETLMEQLKWAAVLGGECVCPPEELMDGTTLGAKGRTYVCGICGEHYTITEGEDPQNES